MSKRVCWISLAPIIYNIDFYPKLIAEIIEHEYSNKNPNLSSTIPLGSDFFDATIHLHKTGIMYQTTPPRWIKNESKFKRSGYRSVKRFELITNFNKIIVYGKQKYGEWRIVNSEEDSEKRFEVTVPKDVIIIHQ